MIRLGSLWYNCLYWLRFETLSSYKSSAVSDLVIIRLACTKANSYSDFVTHLPSLEGVLLCYLSIKFGGSPLITPSHSYCLICLRARILSRKVTLKHSFYGTAFLPSVSLQCIVSKHGIRTACIV